MLLTVVLLILLYLYVIVRAVQFFLMDGVARDDDKIIAAGIIASSVMFVLARVVTSLIDPGAVQSADTTMTLWGGVGLFNGMFYLGLLHRMIECRGDQSQSRHRRPSEPRGIAH